MKNRIIINPEQNSFRKGNSVLDNMLLLKDKVMMYEKQKQLVYTYIIDLSKAFDSVPLNELKSKPHTILLEGNFCHLKPKTIKILRSSTTEKHD